MKRILSALLVAALAMTLAGCSSLTVKYDYDNNVNFGKYRTFAWIAKDGSMPATAQEAQNQGDLLDRRIRNAIESVMAQRGLKPAESGADLLVIYHTGAQEKIQVTDWGYRYSDYYWGYGGKQIDVYQYTEGMIVIDLVDAESTNLVWRGSGTGVVDKSQKSPEEQQARINDVVAQVMENFPPTARK